MVIPQTTKRALVKEACGPARRSASVGIALEWLPSAS